MLIFVRQANGNGYSLNVESDWMLFSIFQLINWENTTDPSNFTIFFKGSLLQQTQKTFKDYNIKQNDIIHLVSKKSKNDRQTHFNISIFYNNQTYSIRVKNKQKLHKIKTDVFQLTRVNPREQFLVLNGKRCDDNLTIQQNHIENGSLLTLIKRKSDINYLGPKQTDPQQNDLLKGVTSLRLQRKESVLTKQSKTTLFRSDSLGAKAIQEYAYPEVQVKNLNFCVDLTNSIDSQLQLNKLFGNTRQRGVHNLLNQTQQKYKLLNSCKQNLLIDFFPKTFIKQDHEDENSYQKEIQIESLYEKLNFDSNSLFSSLEFQHQQLKIKTLHQLGQKQNQKIKNQNPQTNLIKS